MKTELFKSVLFQEVATALEGTNWQLWIAENLPRLAPNEEILLKTNCRTEGDLEILAVISRFCEEVPRFLILEYLDSRKKPNLKIEIEAIATMTFERMCLYLSREFSERDFFGNFLPKVRRILASLRLTLWKPSRPKEKIRHRGYRDKGSQRPSDRWLPTSDWSFIEEQNKIEEDRFVEEMTLFFYRGFG